MLADPSTVHSFQDLGIRGNGLDLAISDPIYWFEVRSITSVRCPCGLQPSFAELPRAKNFDPFIMVLGVQRIVVTTISGPVPCLNVRDCVRCFRRVEGNDDIADVVVGCCILCDRGKKSFLNLVFSFYPMAIPVER